MRETLRYRDQDGSIYEVPTDEEVPFHDLAAQEGRKLEEVRSFRGQDGSLYDVPRSELAQFQADAQGQTFEPVRSFMDDAKGDSFDVAESELPQFIADAQAEGQTLPEHLTRDQSAVKAPYEQARARVQAIRERLATEDLDPTTRSKLQQDAAQLSQSMRKQAEAEQAAGIEQAQVDLSRGLAFGLQEAASGATMGVSDMVIKAAGGELIRPDTAAEGVIGGALKMAGSVLTQKYLGEQIATRLAGKGLGVFDATVRTRMATAAIDNTARGISNVVTGKQTPGEAIRDAIINTAGQAVSMVPEMTAAPGIRNFVAQVATGLAYDVGTDAALTDRLTRDNWKEWLLQEAPVVALNAVFAGRDLADKDFAKTQVAIRKDFMRRFEKRVQADDAFDNAVAMYGADAVSRSQDGSAIDVRVPDGRQLRIEFVPDESSLRGAESGAARYESTRAKYPELAADALAKAKGDKEKAGSILLETTRTRGKTDSNVVITDHSTGNEVKVDTLVQLVGGTVKAGVLSHEEFHAMARMIGVQMPDGKVLDPQTGRLFDEERLAAELERGDNTPAAQKVRDLALGVVNLFTRGKQETPYKTARRLLDTWRSEIREGIPGEKPKPAATPAPKPIPAKSSPPLSPSSTPSTPSITSDLSAPISTTPAPSKIDPETAEIASRFDARVHAPRSLTGPILLIGAPAKPKVGLYDAQGRVIPGTGDIPQKAQSPTQWQAKTPKGEAMVGGLWRVVEAKDILTSDKPGYDQTMQPRNRDTQSSKEQVASISIAPDPSRLMDSPTTDTGAPIVDRNGQVISGNGRVMGLRTAYGSGKAESYRKTVLEKARTLGLKEAEFMREPVLVREMTDTGGRAPSELAELSNRPQILERNQAEISEADGKMLSTSNLIDAFAPDQKGNVRAESNRDFLRGFVRATGANNLVDSKGNFSPEVDGRVQRALLSALTFQHPQSRQTTTEIVERADDLNLKRLVQGVTSAAPSIVRLAQSKPTYDLRPEIGQALADLVAYRKLKASGTVRVMDDYLGQNEMFATGRTPESELLTRAFESAKTIEDNRNILQNYATLAQKIDTSTPDMFGNASATKAELLNKAVENAGKVNYSIGKAEDGAEYPFVKRSPARVSLVKDRGEFKVYKLEDGKYETVAYDGGSAWKAIGFRFSTPEKAEAAARIYLRGESHLPGEDRPTGPDSLSHLRKGNPLRPLTKATWQSSLPIPVPADHRSSVDQAVSQLHNTTDRQRESMFGELLPDDYLPILERDGTLSLSPYHKANMALVDELDKRGFSNVSDAIISKFDPPDTTDPRYSVTTSADSAEHQTISRTLRDDSFAAIHQKLQADPRRLYQPQVFQGMRDEMDSWSDLDLYKEAETFRKLSEIDSADNRGALAWITYIDRLKQKADAGDKKAESELENNIAELGQSAGVAAQLVRQMAEFSKKNRPKIESVLGKKDWSDITLALMQGNALTPVSVAANTIGNIVNEPLRGIAQTIGALSEGLLHRAGLVKRRTVGQPILDAAAGVRGFARSLRDESGTIIKTGVAPSRLPAGGEQHRGFQPVRAWVKLMATPKPGESRLTPNERAKLFVEGTLGVPAETMFRALTLTDAPYYGGFRVRYLNELGRLQGLSGKALDAWGKAPPKWAKDLSEELSRDGVYQGNNALYNAISPLLRMGTGKDSTPGSRMANVLLLRPLMLFAKTPANVAAEAHKFVNPFWSLGSTLYHASKARQATAMNKPAEAFRHQREAFISSGRMFTGMVLWGLADAAVNSGLVSGMGGAGEKEKELAKTGLKPFHVNADALARLVNGGDPAARPGDKMVDYRNLGIFGLMLNMASTGNELAVAAAAADQETYDPNAQPAVSRMAQTAFRLPTAMLDMSMMKGMATFAQALQGDTTGSKMRRLILQHVETVSGVALPNSMKAISNMTLDWVPETSTIARDGTLQAQADAGARELANRMRAKLYLFDALHAKFSGKPVGRIEELPVKMDIFGRAVRTTPEGRSSLLFFGLDTMKAESVPFDQYNREVTRLFGLTNDRRVIPSIPEDAITNPLTRQRQRLTEAQRERYQQIHGTITRWLYDATMKSPQWEGMDDRLKSYYLAQINSKVNDLSRERMLAELTSKPTSLFVTRS